ncbi:hypothetical protein PCE1_000901 [Barthelona sp. PCE]
MLQIRARVLSQREDLSRVPFESYLPNDNVDFDTFPAEVIRLYEVMEQNGMDTRVPNNRPTRLSDRLKEFEKYVEEANPIQFFFSTPDMFMMYFDNGVLSAVQLSNWDGGFVHIRIDYILGSSLNTKATSSAISNNIFATALDDSSLKITTYESQHAKEFPAPVTKMLFSADSSLLMCQYESNVEICSLGSQELRKLFTYRSNRSIIEQRWVESQLFLIEKDDQGTYFLLLNPETERIQQRKPPRVGELQCFACLDRIVFATSDRGKLFCFTHSGKQLAEYQDPQKRQITHISASSPQGYVIVVFEERYLSLFHWGLGRIDFMFNEFVSIHQEIDMCRIVPNSSISQITLASNCRKNYSLVSN